MYRDEANPITISVGDHDGIVGISVVIGENGCEYDYMYEYPIGFELVYF